MRKLLLILPLLLMACGSEETVFLADESYAVVEKIENTDCEGLCNYTVRHARTGYSDNYSYEFHPCDWHIVGDTVYVN